MGGRTATGDRMSSDYVNDLIQAVTRVVTPNALLLKEVLVIGGMPEPTQNLQYLSYNRYTTVERGRYCEFSAVAVINNRRARELRLVGTQKKISRWVFSTRWTRNPLDLFLNNLRCDPALMNVLDHTACNYSLLGILTVNAGSSAEAMQREGQYICPVVAVPGVEGQDQNTIEAFEAANQIKKSRIIGLQVYRKTGNQMAGG